jgi:hypothetical protein
VTDERHDDIDRILTLLSQYWHAAPELRLGQIIGNLAGHDENGEPIAPYAMNDADAEKSLRWALSHLDYKPIARHPAGCVAHANHVGVWLRDGTKVMLKRDPETKGRAWLEVEKQATVHPAGTETAPKNADFLRAEIATVQRLLRGLADDRVFERTGLEARLADLEAELAKAAPTAAPEVKMESTSNATADWPTLSPAEKCEAVFKRIVELVNERHGLRVGFEADWGGNSLTVYVDDSHSHTGDPDWGWENLVEGLYRMFCTGGALGLCGPGRQVSSAQVDEVAKTPKVCGAEPSRLCSMCKCELGEDDEGSKWCLDCASSEDAALRVAEELLIEK